MTETREPFDGWAALSDKKWVELHVPRFIAVGERYVIFAGFLKEVLKEAAGRHTPLAIIETRAKSVPSFAEKILRKRNLYMDPKNPLPPDPLVRITDLCGGRIITQTSDQVQALCEFIERAFEIDWPNSEDVSQRLKPTEFGYRSVHYIVSVDPAKLAVENIASAVPAEILGLKAEIQVRTLLEHAWADIGHDMAYKTEINVPTRIRRQFATLAAVLEGVDREFGRLVHSLEEFKSNFGAYHKREEVEDEIARLRIVLAHDRKNFALAEKIAQLALAIGRHEEALEILRPYAEEPHPSVQRIRGITLTEMHGDHPHTPSYREGRDCLERACPEDCQDAETLCALAESWVPEDESRARNLFARAIAKDATEPVTLGRYLEFEIAHLSDNSVVRLATPMIRNAMDRCRKELEAGVNLPRAWSSLALFHLLLNEPFDALSALAQVIRLCEAPRDEPCEHSHAGGTRTSCGRPGAAGRTLLRMRETLRRLHGIRKLIDGFDWFKRLLLLGLAAALKDAEAKETIRLKASWNGGTSHLSGRERIVVLSGACAAEFQRAVEAFKPHLLRACDGLSLTLLSGGTLSGISGLAGDVAEQSGRRIRAFGYLPRGVRQDLNPARFSQNFSSPEADFTPFDPQQGWIDLLAAGVDPCSVKVLGYGNGQISQTECIMGLALGARVGVVEDPVLPKDRRFNDPDWQDHPNLVRLPLDAMTLRAFLLIGEVPCKRPEFAKAARKAHEEYVKSAAPRDPSLLPWDEISEDLKISNYHQVAYAENILKTEGLGIRPIAGRNKPPVNMEDLLGREAIERLAEKEHGRWSVERLMRGWRYAETKDVAHKLSPYLVPWELLPPEIRQYDLDSILNLSEKLKEADLEIYRLGSGPLPTSCTNC